MQDAAATAQDENCTVTTLHGKQRCSALATFLCVVDGRLVRQAGCPHRHGAGVGRGGGGIGEWGPPILQKEGPLIGTDSTCSAKPVKGQAVSLKDAACS